MALELLKIDFLYMPTVLIFAYICVTTQKFPENKKNKNHNYKIFLEIANGW